MKTISLRSLKPFSISLWILFGIILTMISCSSPAARQAEKSVNVSILPQKYLVDRLSDQKIQVNVVVRSGYNPETYEPTPLEIKNLESAGLYLQLCQGGFDQTWVSQLQENNSNLKVVDLSKGIALISEGEDHGDHHHVSGIDPHVWVSPSTMKQLLINTRDALVLNFPDDSATLNRNFTQLWKEVAGMDSLFASTLSSLKQKSFIVYHPVLTYVARDYGLTQLSIEASGKEPSVKSISELIQFARQSDIGLIFIQQEFDTRHAQLVAEETGARIVRINPLSYDWMNESQTLLNIFKSEVNFYKNKP